MAPNTSIQSETISKKIIRKIWSVLPVILLILVIVILSGRIKAKKQMAEAKKKGLQALQAMTFAAENIDEIITVIRSSENSKDAVGKLASDLSIPERQAEAIVHMPLGRLTKMEQETIMEHAAAIEEEMEQKGEKMIQAGQLVNVVAMELTPTTIRDRINFPGTIEPWIRLEIHAEVRGKVLKKKVFEGASIKKDDVIAILDSRDYEHAYRSAKASYQAAVASKERLSELFKKQLATLSQLDNAVAQAENYKAQMDTAKLNVERCTIRSPISGTVNRLFFEEGEYLNFSDKVSEVLQTNKLKVSVGIPESDVDSIRKLKSFDVTIDALDKKVVKATKHYLSKTTDSMARLYNLELMIDNTAGEILPDMFVRVDILKREVPNSIAIPLYSLISISNENIAYIIEDNIAYAKQVELGIQEGWLVEIKSGLKKGDKLVAVGQRDVSNGQKVKVIRTVTNPEELSG
jgi:membrane fusion protein, multidrug efflux system